MRYCQGRGGEGRRGEEGEGKRGEGRRGEGRRERGGGREVEEIYFGDKVEEGEEEDLERKGRQLCYLCFPFCSPPPHTAAETQTQTDKNQQHQCPAPCSNTYDRFPRQKRSRSVEISKWRSMSSAATHMESFTANTFNL